jgi:archaeal type IV pilus assembly protein PilA
MMALTMGDHRWRTKNMKKIWKIRKDSKAVSPVIATILMVAITVVLAAVLYVMVMGFGGGEAQTPTGSFTSAEKHNATTYYLFVGAISPTTNWDECKLSVDGTATTNALGDGVNQTAGTGVWVIPTDLAGDDKISSGDYIILGGLSAGEHTVALLYIETGGTIGSKTFTWAA